MLCRIEEYADAERALLKRLSMRNELEANVYRLKDLMQNDTFRLSLNPSEIESLLSSLEVSGRLVEEPEEEHKYEDYEESLKRLLSPEQDMIYRQQEVKCRPEAIRRLREEIKNKLLFVEKTRKDYPNEEDRGQTNADLEQLESKAQTYSIWLNTTEEKQSLLGPTDNPVSSCNEFDTRSRELNRLYLSIAFKKPPVKKSEVSPQVLNKTEPVPIDIIEKGEKRQDDPSKLETEENPVQTDRDRMEL